MRRSLRALGRRALWLVLGMLCSAVATCGQKGPLELPDDEQATAPRPDSDNHAVYA